MHAPSLSVIPRSNFTHSQQSLDNLSSFPRLSTLKSGKTFDGACFNANHFLPAIFWSEITHSFTLFNPWVPDYDVGEAISFDAEDGFVACVDGDVLVCAGVDAVKFA